MDQGDHPLLHDGFQLLHHQRLIGPGQGLQDHSAGQGIGCGHLHQAYGSGKVQFLQDLLHRTIGRAAGDDHLPGSLGTLVPVEGQIADRLFDRLHPLDELQPHPAGVDREIDPAGGIGPESISLSSCLITNLVTCFVTRLVRLTILPSLSNHGRPLGQEAQGHIGPGVGDAGGGLDHHRLAPLLGEGERGGGHLLGLLGRRGLQDGQMGLPGQEPVVLLGVGAVHPGVVGHEDHQAAAHSHVGVGLQWFGGHVEPNPLHGGDRAQARHGTGDGGLGGHLLVHRPFGMVMEGTSASYQIPACLIINYTTCAIYTIFILPRRPLPGFGCQRLLDAQQGGHHLGGRGARIGRGQPQAAFQQSPGQGLVAQQWHGGARGSQQGLLQAQTFPSTLFGPEGSGGPGGPEAPFACAWFAASRLRAPMDRTSRRASKDDSRNTRVGASGSGSLSP